MSDTNNITQKNRNKKLANWVAARNQYGLNLPNNLSRNIANAKRRRNINLQNEVNNKRRTNWRKHWGSQTRTRGRMWGMPNLNVSKRRANYAKRKANNLAYRLQNPLSLRARFYNLLANE
jgi:hypothetical protein